MVSLDDLGGTICVVTGAGHGGIGYGICEVAAEAGLDIAVLDLHTSVCDEAASRLQRAHTRIRAAGVQCDVTQAADLARARERIGALFPGKRIGALFANAGVYLPAGGVLDSPAAEWRVTLDVNVLGVVHTLQALVPEMKRHRAPSVVCTTASIAGLMRAAPYIASYCASKHAVVALTEALSLELATAAPHVHACVLCPCVVATGLVESSRISRAGGAGDVKMLDPSTAAQPSPANRQFGMAPVRHARQVFDRIAAGEFYMITDSVRPYVDHDFPLGGAEMVEARAAALLQPDFERRIDNSGAPHNPHGARFASPMINEQLRLRRAARQDKKARL
eukprot:g1440.t1